MQATNDGSALGIGTSSTNCSVTVSVNQVPLPPVVSTTTFNAVELSALGTVVGNVGASDPSNFSISNYSWAAIDYPNAFAIDNSGLITISASIDTLALSKSVWAYVVAVCNAFICGQYAVTIDVAVTPRPPVIAPQNRSVAENAAGGSFLTPALIATQPQGLAMNFSVAPTTVFGIQPSTGVLYLQSFATLNFKATSFYALTVAVTTSAGTSASAPVGVLVSEVIKPPFFTAPAFFATVSEGATSGTLITTLTASYLNTVDSLKYVLYGAKPAGAASWFSLDGVSGALSVSYALPGSVLLADRTLTYTAGFYTVNVSVGVINSAGLTANATAVVSVLNIAPRVVSVNATIAANSTGGLVVASLAPAVWSPYVGARLTYSLTAPVTPTGYPSLSLLNASSGVVTVTNVTFTDPRTGLVVNAPGYNVNSQPVIYSSWQVRRCGRWQ